MQTHQLTLFADYHQFYLQDEATSGGLAQAWIPEAIERMLAVADGVVGFGTLRNMQVGVTLEMLEEPPGAETTDFDHVVEGSLDARSGTLVVAGCTDYVPDAARFAPAPGTYRVRLSVSGADTLSEDGLEGEDHYWVQLWPALFDASMVLKHGAF